MENKIIFLIGIIVLTVIQFMELWGYLFITKKIKNKSIIKEKILVSIFWLIMSALTCINGIFGIKFVSYSSMSLNKAAGIIPVMLGFLLSILIFRSDWKNFHTKFNQK